MFVAKWNPGPIPQKPELTSAPVWIELRNTPHQFFNEDGFEHIAGLVGEPKGLHPSTANLTNLEVAKVFTIIDPRKPLPEAVNVQFDSGEICRVLVSSPWMPLVCSFCKEVGHSLKRCPTAPSSCDVCKSACHSSATCPRASTKRKKSSVYKEKPRDPASSQSTIPPSKYLVLNLDKGKALAAGVVDIEPGQGSHSLTCLPATPANPSTKIFNPGALASQSEWIQVKPRAAKKYASPLGQGSICIDIGLDNL